MTSRQEAPRHILDPMVTNNWRNRIVLRSPSGYMYWCEVVAADELRPVWLTHEETAEVEELIKKRKP